MRMKTTYNAEKLRILTELVAARIEELLDIFEIEYSVVQGTIRGPCPVHDGDNQTGWSIITGDEIALRWRCYTHGCHDRQKWGGNIFGLVRALLSKKEKRNVTFQQSVDYLGNFVGRKYEAIHVNESQLNKARFTSRVNAITKQRPKEVSQITRSIVRKSLQIPAQYYLDKDYNGATLDKYDVGLCHTRGKKMMNRVVVPIYDDDYRVMVGCTGRTIFPHCGKCDYYHAESYHCPTNDVEKYFGTKWIHSDGFSASRYLYNYWFAKDHIREAGVAILVEGPGDVWKLEQNGIHCGLGMFGTSLNDEQSIILEQSGAMSLVIMLDNDEPGQQAADRLRKQLGRLYRLHFPSFSGHDIGDMSNTAIVKEIKPFLAKL